MSREQIEEIRNRKLDAQNIFDTYEQLRRDRDMLILEVEALNVSVKAAKAEALREAASEIDEWIRAGADGEASAAETWQWLRDRADTLDSHG